MKRGLCFPWLLIIFHCTALWNGWVYLGSYRCGLTMRNTDGAGSHPILPPLATDRQIHGVGDCREILQSSRLRELLSDTIMLPNGVILRSAQGGIRIRGGPLRELRTTSQVELTWLQMVKWLNQVSRVWERYFDLICHHYASLQNCSASPISHSSLFWGPGGQFQVGANQLHTSAAWQHLTWASETTMGIPAWCSTYTTWKPEAVPHLEHLPFSPMVGPQAMANWIVYLCNAPSSALHVFRLLYLTPQ